MTQEEGFAPVDKALTAVAVRWAASAKKLVAVNGEGVVSVFGAKA